MNMRYKNGEQDKENYFLWKDLCCTFYISCISFESTVMMKSIPFSVGRIHVHCILVTRSLRSIVNSGSFILAYKSYRLYRTKFLHSVWWLARNCSVLRERIPPFHRREEIRIFQPYNSSVHSVKRKLCNHRQVSLLFWIVALLAYMRTLSSKIKKTFM
jgi:hypothetical protein